MKPILRFSSMNFLRASCLDAKKEKANWRLSTFFWIDLKVIRIIRNEYFSLGFAENVSKFVILRRDIRKVRSLCKFCKVGLNVQRAKIELKFARAQKF